MANIDLRVIRVAIEVDGQVNTYEGLNISATGTRYGNPNQNEAEIKISNLTQTNRDFILTQTSPYNLNKTPKKVYLYAGRVSTGVTLVFSGNVVVSQVSQPPDITISLKCLSQNYEKGKIISQGAPAETNLSNIAGQAAQNLGVALSFEATDRKISNYNFTGGALAQVDKLGQIGGIDAYLDNDTLVMKDMSVPLKNVITVVNENTGMVGQPEVTEQGIKVKFLLNGQTVVGGLVDVTSLLNPTINGRYVIYKLSFEINNRYEPFYWIAEGVRSQ